MHDSSQESDVSGMEMESPYKSLAATKEFPCNIPGVGDIRTAWIGQHGVSEIQKQLEEKKKQNEEKTTTTQFKVLASECLKAFEVAGMKESDEPQVKKAIELCSSYVPKAIEHSTSSSIAALWKESSEMGAHRLQMPHSLATAVLGETLVATITEDKHKPPDVSVLVVVTYMSCTCLQCCSGTLGKECRNTGTPYTQSS